MPTLETAVVYPGQCLLEGSNLSEGRGTTRPFEICGAPWPDATRLAKRLNAEKHPGVVFRPVWYRPTFQKYADIRRFCMIEPAGNHLQLSMPGCSAGYESSGAL